MNDNGIMINAATFLNDSHFDKLSWKERPQEYLQYMETKKEKYLQQILALEEQINTIANAVRNKTSTGDEYFSFLDWMETPMKAYCFCLMAMAEVKYDLQPILTGEDL